MLILAAELHSKLRLCCVARHNSPTIKSYSKLLSLTNIGSKNTQI